MMDPDVPLRRVAVIGAGGFGREVLDVIDALADAEPAGVIDDGAPDVALLEARGVTLLGSSAVLDTLEADVEIVIAVGSGQIRASLADAVDAAGVSIASLLHPMSSMGHGNRHGDGLIMCAGARVTTNVVLGRHVHLNLNATVGHDARLGDHVSVFPGATISGGVTIGNRSTIGTGANLIPGVTVGADCFVGAGAVVVRDVPDGATVAGVPAKILDR